MPTSMAMTTKSLFTAADIRETTQMLMKPFANWEEYLTPAPLSIAIMVELVFISSKDDFSINKIPPRDGYKYLLHPDSFRASLKQVFISVRHALKVAQKNMAQIHNITAIIPDYIMKAASKITFQDIDEFVMTLLLNQLKDISDIKDDTDNEYYEVIHLIQEFLVACVNAEYFYGDELEKVRIKLEEAKIKRLDSTIKMLVKGLDAMARVKTQWEKMVRFFQMVSDIVKCSLNKTLKDFVTKADDIKTLSYIGKLFAKDLLYNQAFHASNIASLVHMISGTYTEVSNKYLMDRVSSLGMVLAMDSSKPEFLQRLERLRLSCDAAQRGILDLVCRNKREFERNTSARIAEFEKVMLPNPGKTKPGFSEEDANANEFI